jgi:hypothetical protein
MTILRRQNCTGPILSLFVTGVAFSPDGCRLVVRQPKDAGLVIFDLESGKEIRR